MPQTPQQIGNGGWGYGGAWLACDDPEMTYAEKHVRLGRDDATHCSNQRTLMNLCGKFMR